MKYPIDIAIWVIGNLDNKDPENIRNALVFVARGLNLNAMDSELLSLAFHLVSRRPYFCRPDSIKKAEAVLEENGETTVLRKVIGEIRANAL